MSLDIDRVLEKRGLNKSSLSTMLGKSRSYVQNALKNPTLETLQSIADALDVEVKDLFVSTKDKAPAELIEDLKETLGELDDKLKL